MKKTDRDDDTVHTYDNTANCCGFISTFFEESATTVPKILQGAHDSSSNLGSGINFVWTKDKSSKSTDSVESIASDFSNTEQVSDKWPFKFLNDDLDYGDKITTDGTTVKDSKTFEMRRVSFVPNAELMDMQSSRKKRFLIGSLLLAVIAATCALYGQMKRAEPFLSESKSESFVGSARLMGIKNMIIASNLTKEESFEDPNSVQNSALMWLAEMDPLQMPLDDPLILQRYAMATLFFTLPRLDEGTTNFSKWLTGRPICEWEGISCQSNGKVADITSIKVHLYKEMLDGIGVMLLPRELFLSFRGLKHLDLRGVGFTAIPQEVGYLLNLETLLLGGNELTGSLPDLSKLTNLKILGLQDNHFTGNIPDDTWSMKKLEALYLDGNHLTGTVSVNIQNLRNLSDLRLRDNELSGGIEFLDGMSELRVCYLDHNQFEGNIPANIASLKYLKSMTLNNNKLSGTIPFGIQKLVDLEHFIASHNALTGPLPIEFKEIPKLNHLWLAGNAALTGLIPMNLCSTVNITIDCENIYCPCCKQCI